MKWVLIAFWTFSPGVTGKMHVLVDSPKRCAEIAAAWIEQAQPGSEMVSFSCQKDEGK